MKKFGGMCTSLLVGWSLFRMRARRLARGLRPCRTAAAVKAPV